MTFGKASGPPASAKQVRELLELLEAAGHEGFRDARGPLGFDQRQATGKFTRDDAQSFIDRLQDEAHELGGAPAQAQPSTRPSPVLSVLPVSVRTAPNVRRAPAERAIRAASDRDLLDEVRRRGLTVQP